VERGTKQGVIKIFRPTEGLMMPSPYLIICWVGVGTIAIGHHDKNLIILMFRGGGHGVIKIFRLAEGLMMPFPYIIII